MYNNVYNIDSRNLLETIEDKYVSVTITSPPYYDMKDYGSPSQIGFGQTYEEYLCDLQNVFEKIYKITKDDGTLWIVIDTFKKNGAVVPLPFDLVAKLVKVGWLLQDIIIWKKDKTVPWSGNGFVQRKFEYILFFSKSKTFKYYKDRVRVYDTSHLKRWWVKYPERYNPRGKALDEVWEYPIPTQGSWGDKYIKHFCPLPTDMVGTMVQLSTDEGDIVLDPFAGSGSVLVQAAFMKRGYIGFELNRSYIDMFQAYLSKTLTSGIKKYELFDSRNAQDGFESTILNLRALKFAKLIRKKIKEYTLNNDFLVGVEVVGSSDLRYKLIKATYDIIGVSQSENIDNAIAEISKQPPLSKFGIEPIFSYCVDFDVYFEKSSSLFGYTETNTHYFHSRIISKNIDSKVKIVSSIGIQLNESDFE